MLYYFVMWFSGNKVHSLLILNYTTAYNKNGIIIRVLNKSQNLPKYAV